MSDRLEDQQTSHAFQGKQKSKQQTGADQKLVSTCAFMGAALFFVLNITTGVVPGGFIGGAIGGALGAIVGMIINSLIKKKT